MCSAIAGFAANQKREIAYRAQTVARPRSQIVSPSELRPDSDHSVLETCGLQVFGAKETACVDETRMPHELRRGRQVKLPVGGVSHHQDHAVGALERVGDLTSICLHEWVVDHDLVAHRA